MDNTGGIIVAVIAILLFLVFWKTIKDLFFVVLAMVAPYYISEFIIANFNVDKGYFIGLYFIFFVISFYILFASRDKMRESKLEKLKKQCQIIPSFKLSNMNYTTIDRITADSEIELLEKAISLGGNGVVIESEQTSTSEISDGYRVSKDFFGGYSLKSKGSHTITRRMITAFAIRY